MPASQRMKIYTLDDVASHNTRENCWVVHNNKIYDVTNFLVDHPGSPDFILQHAGKDVTAIMVDPDEHEHSQAAYAILQEFQVGIVGEDEHLLDANYVWSERFDPNDLLTETDEDFARTHFIDLKQPLIMQVLRSNWSKAFYLQQVHQPRHLPHPARLFGPWYLEMFTQTPWYIVPLVWLPIAALLMWKSLHQQPGVALLDAAAKSAPYFFLGNFIWTLLEYGVHRFVFHIERFLPDHPFFLMIHFTAHGIHHYIPMDHLRLVMPPILFATLEFPFTRLAYALFQTWVANAIISGAFAAYVVYDMIHYSLHHTKLPNYVRKLKSHHMNHHYLEPNLGYGITNMFWDWVFGTEFVKLPATKTAKAI